MELSNKSLAILLLAAMVVSLGGTIMSLNRMNQVEYVGFATSATGSVNLTVESSKSITTADANVVNFGTCNTSAGRTDYINSELTDNTTSRCSMAAANNISVRNDGNIEVAVTIQFGDCAPGFGNASCTFLDSSTNEGTLAYKTTSAGRGAYTGGCTGVVATYTAVNGTNNLAACTTLATHPTANSFVTNFRVGLPYDVPVGQSNLVVTYAAS
ncbi:MAG: hypothetical protein WC758_04535 [Candidatus Woesearchaeota archaeon]